MGSSDPASARVLPSPYCYWLNNMICLFPNSCRCLTVGWPVFALCFAQRCCLLFRGLQLPTFMNLPLKLFYSCHVLSSSGSEWRDVAGLKKAGFRGRQSLDGDFLELTCHCVISESFLILCTTVFSSLK